MSINRAVAPQVYNFDTFTLTPPSTHTLPNGIHVHIESGSDIEVSRLTVAIPGGEAESPKPGLAACTATMLIEGTKRMTGKEIANTLEYNGAWVNTSVMTHYTAVNLLSLNEKFAELLPIFAEIITLPSFPTEATAQILQRQAARIEIEHEKMTFIADKTIRPIVYGEDNPLARTETAEEIRAFTADKLSKFHYSRLDPKNIHIFLAGNITDEMAAAVDRTFSTLGSSKGFDLTPLRFTTPQPQQQRVDITVEHARQSAVKIMLPSVGRTDDDFVALRAAVTALGGYFGSRLMLNIREDKGLTYGISAALLGYPDRSFITISTQTDSSTKEEVINLICEEMERMKDPESYTDDEIKRLSKFILSNLATTLDTPFSRMDYTQTHIFADTPDDYFERQDATARNLSPELLAGIARRYFDTSKLIIATAGN